MKKFLVYAFLVLLLGSLSVSKAEGIVLSEYGALCWDANSEPDLEGYFIRYVGPSGPTVPEYFLLAFLNIPQVCLDRGQTGTPRDQNTDVDGEYAGYVGAYDISGNESPYSVGFFYTLLHTPLPDTTPPDAPTGCMAF